MLPVILWIFLFETKTIISLHQKKKQNNKK